MRKGQEKRRLPSPGKYKCQLNITFRPKAGQFTVHPPYPFPRRLWAFDNKLKVGQDNYYNESNRNGRDAMKSQKKIGIGGKQAVPAFFLWPVSQQQFDDNNCKVVIHRPARYITAALVPLHRPHSPLLCSGKFPLTRRTLPPASPSARLCGTATYKYSSPPPPLNMPPPCPWLAVDGHFLRKPPSAYCAALAALAVTRYFSALREAENPIRLIIDDELMNHLIIANFS